MGFRLLCKHISHFYSKYYNVSNFDMGWQSKKGGGTIEKVANSKVILWSFTGPGCVKSRKNLSQCWASPKYERFCINIVVIKSTWNKLLLYIGFHLPLSQMIITFHTVWANLGPSIINLSGNKKCILSLLIIKDLYTLDCYNMLLFNQSL